MKPPRQSPRRTVTGSERIFRFLLRAYPERFRSRYAEDLVAFFHADRRHPKYGGRFGWTRFWWRTGIDLLRAAVVERFRANRNPPRRGSVGGSLRVDLRHAVAGLMHNPLYTGIATLTMALGIGATVAVFSVVHGVLLTPLPFPESDRLIQIFEVEAGVPQADWFAYGNYTDVREQAAALAETGIWAYDAKSLTASGEARRLRARQVSASLFPLLRVAPALGRSFGSDDEAGINGAVTVLSHHVWARVFGSDSSVVGTAVNLDGTPYTVVGVMPQGFDFPNQADLWIPLPPETDPVGLRRWHRYRVAARLVPGVPIDTVQTQLDRIATNLEGAFPETNTGNRFRATTLLDATVGEVGTPLRLILGAVAFLFLISCVNVAGLILARASTRHRELAIRTALGAGRGRLVSLLLTESCVLAVVGGSIGLLLAGWGTDIMVALSAGSIPRDHEIHLGLPVVQFALITSLLAGLLSGLWPAVRRPELGPMLHGNRTSADYRTRRFRRLLVTGELALTVLLATGAGLLVKSFGRLQSVDPGIRADGVLTLTLSLPRTAYSAQEQVVAFYSGLIEHIETIPGVQRAAGALMLPVTGPGWRNTFRIRNRTVPETEIPAVAYVVTTPGYFETLGIPVRTGRTYRPADYGSTEPVVVINEAAAHRFFATEDPVGKFVLGHEAQGRPWARVIGVVGDVRESLHTEPVPTAYVPLSQDRVTELAFLVRTAGDPQSAWAAVRTAVREADPEVAISDVGILSERIARTIAQPRFNATLLTVFAGLAMTLSAVGVYGMLAYAVTRRRRELGIRMAMGADRRSVWWMVIREALTICAAGLAIGVASSLIIARLLTTILFEVRSNDPTTVTTVAITVMVVALGASVLPAYRATTIDPMIAVRTD